MHSEKNRDRGRERVGLNPHSFTAKQCDPRLAEVELGPEADWVSLHRASSSTSVPFTDKKVEEAVCRAPTIGKEPLRRHATITWRIAILSSVEGREGCYTLEFADQVRPK